MSNLYESFQDLLDSGGVSVGQFAASLPLEWIEEALRATGKSSMRRRKLPAESAVWLVIGMGLFADRAICAVVDHLNLVLPGVAALAKSAVTKSRYRLGVDPLAHLFAHSASAWAQQTTTHAYRGLDLYAVDGVTLRVADSDENFAHFGKPGGRGGKSDAGYPQARCACLLNVGSRLIAAAQFGPYNTSERKLAEPLWDQIPERSLTLLDRGFVNYATFAQLLTGDARHFLVRMRKDVSLYELEDLQDGSLLASIRPSTKLRASCPEIRSEIKVRVIAYEHEGGEPSRILTSLIDPDEFPAEELVELYHQRWEIELAYDEVKTHMLDRKESLRSKLPDGVNQEIWGLLIAYNLVRREMAIAAEAADLPPSRIGFRLSLLEVRNLIFLAVMTRSPGTLPAHIKDLPRKVTSLVLPKRRTERRYPRQVKIKMSNFARNRGKRGAPT